MNAETCTEVVGATELPAQEPDQVEALARLLANTQQQAEALA